jgi:hypothetical protein
VAVFRDRPAGGVGPEDLAGGNSEADKGPQSLPLSNSLASETANRSVSTGLLVDQAQPSAPGLQEFALPNV